MYHIFYLFRVQRKNVDRFLQIAGDAGVIYRQHGAVATAILRLTDGSDKYGCLGLAGQVQTSPEEQLFLGIDSFRDAEQLRTLTARIDSDPRIQKLFKEIQEVVDLRKAIRWEAEDAT
jgi:hypothetical protein